MKVLSCVKDNEENYSFSVIADEKEVGILINIALGALIAVGTINDLDEDYDIDLSNIPIEDFFQA